MRLEQLKSVFHFSYLVHKKTNLQFFIEQQLTYIIKPSLFQYSILIGIRSQLWNDYRNY
jgi:hypothetical protein